MDEIKIKDSKGDIYNSCPFIDEILTLCNQQAEIIIKIKKELEKVRKINEALRENQRDESEIKKAVEEAVEKAVEEAKDEVWGSVAYIMGTRNSKYTESYLEDLVKETEELRDENKNLLKEIEGLK